MKYTETRKDGQVELRIAVGQANILVIISGKGGWKYGSNEIPDNTGRYPYRWRPIDTSQFNVRLSMNGVVMLSKQDWDELDALINQTIEGEMQNVSAG